jgi:predicted small lipoprotein YifL
VFPKSASLALIATLALLGGCGRKPPHSADPPASTADDNGYAASPSVQTAAADGAGVKLSGAAAPGAEVRLGTPAGQAVFAKADGAGRWSLVLPPSPDTRIFGLSAASGGRQVQSQGYVVVTGKGAAAQLRSGAGALRLDPRPGPGIGAIDFDQAGAAVISGHGTPQSPVALWLDGRQAAEGRTDAAGRYSLTLSQALKPGAHAVEAAGPGFVSRARVTMAKPAPLASGPMRSQLTEGGVRIDWLTPGGGLQSTLLLD